MKIFSIKRRWSLDQILVCAEDKEEAFEKFIHEEKILNLCEDNKFFDISNLINNGYDNCIICGEDLHTEDSSDEHANLHKKEYLKLFLKHHIEDYFIEEAKIIQ